MSAKPTDFQRCEQYIRESLGIRKTDPLFNDLQVVYFRGLYDGRAEAFEECIIATMAARIKAMEKELRALRWDQATREKAKC